MLVIEDTTQVQAGKIRHKQFPLEEGDVMAKQNEAAAEGNAGMVNLKGMATTK